MGFLTLHLIDGSAPCGPDVDINTPTLYNNDEQKREKGRQKNQRKVDIKKYRKVDSKNRKKVDKKQKKVDNENGESSTAKIEKG